MTRAEALEVAEKLIARLAPATNTRGYADGVAPLEARVNALLRVADFLITNAETHDILSAAGHVVRSIPYENGAPTR